jgi:hypothetical protein
MSNIPSLISITVPYFQSPVYIQSKPDLSKKETKQLMKEAKRSADVFKDDYETYSAVLNETFTAMYDELMRHFLEIRKIENEKILSGSSKEEVMLASNQYSESASKKYSNS